MFTETGVFLMQGRIRYYFFVNKIHFEYKELTFGLSFLFLSHNTKFVRVSKRCIERGCFNSRISFA